MIAIKNATLVMRDCFIPDAVLLIEDGKIVDFGEMRKIDIPAGCEIIDVDGLYVGPGFVDIHTHSETTRCSFRICHSSHFSRGEYMRVYCSQ